MQISSRARITSICVIGLTLIFIASEYIYYFPLTPLSLDTSGKTRLPLAEGKIRLVFVGDILLGDYGRRTIARRGFDHVFSATRPLIQEADLSIGNLEGPISPSGKTDEKEPWSYRMPAEVALALARAGFDLMDLGNNHIADCGDVGIRETQAHLSRAGIAYFGAGFSPEEAHRPAVMNVRGLSVVIFGYHAPEAMFGAKRVSTRYLAVTPGQGGLAMAEPKLVEKDLRQVRARADLVIVLLHMSDRYQKEPTDFERELAHQIIEAGADAVIGHGAHIMGPIEIFQGKPIFYSIGNFAFGSANLMARFSLLAILEIDPRARRLTRLHALPLYTVNKNPWVNFQTKVLYGVQGRRVLRHLLDLSKPHAHELTLETSPLRVSAPL